MKNCQTTHVEILEAYRRAVFEHDRLDFFGVQLPQTLSGDSKVGVQHEVFELLVFFEKN